MAVERKGFTITLRIENYNFSSKLGLVIESPPFVIDATKNESWMLRIFPESTLNPGNISFYVKRTVISTLTNLKIDFEIDIFTDDSYSPILQDSYVFTYGYNSGPALYLIPHHKIYNKERGVPFPPKTLTVRCRMFKSEGSFSEIEQFYVITRLLVEKKALMVYAENFSNLVPSKKTCLTIKSASASEQLFKMNITLDGDLCCKEKVWIEVIPVNKQNMKFCVCKVFLLDSEGIKTECGYSDTIFKEEQWKFPLDFTKGYLMKKNTQFLSNDILRLKCEFVFCTNIEYEQLEDSEFGKIAVVQKLLCDKVQPEFPSAVDDITCLFKEGILCDVKLKTETETFNVHKSILSARSSVFRTMFTTDMREKINDCVVIEDLEADTVRRMIMFLYSDNLEDLDWDRAKSMYFAADKYNIEALKHRCSEFLIRNLQPSDSCDLLLLSDRHQDEKLKTAVQKYIAEHHEEVLQTDLWMMLEKSDPALTTETFRVLYLQNWKN